MKKTIITALIAAASLSLSACGGSTTTTTENVTVTNEVVLDEGTQNLTAVDSLNDTDAALDNAATFTDNATDAASNAVANVTE